MTRDPGRLLAAVRPGDNSAVNGVVAGGRRPEQWVLTVLRAPAAGRTWRELLYCATGLPLGLGGLLAVALPLAAGTALTLSILGAVPGLALLVAGLAAARGTGYLFRRLAGRLLGLRLPPPPPAPPGTGLTGRIDARLRDGTAWRAAAYLVARMPLSFLGGWLVVAVWAYGLYFLSYPLWWMVARHSTRHPAAGRWLSSLLSPFPAGGTHITTVSGAFAIMLLAVPVLPLAPWAGRGVVTIDTWLLRHVLTAPGLAGRVRELEESRAMAVDDAAARLRRVERDLHDGAQARLVAIAMALGLAREKLGDDGELAAHGQARALVDAAHQNAKQAIAELRDLARGIHPPALDQGLPDALATLAAQSQVPVGCTADIPVRPTPAIETIAYFCAAELVANVGKHSGARAASLDARQHDAELRLRIWDNGTGGATATAGGGLAGLAERVRTVDGTMEISSPPGGPTVVVIGLPMHA